MPVDLDTLIDDVPDFPEPGIVFKDIQPLLANPIAFRQAARNMSDSAEDMGITKVLAVESRGFIFGSLVAKNLRVGLCLARKPHKLPKATYSIEYGLEYGQDALAIQRNVLRSTDRVLIVDDVLATGGTARAATSLVWQAAAEPAGLSVLLELTDLHGRERLGIPVHSVLQHSIVHT